jgi:hypothetical protein
MFIVKVLVALALATAQWLELHVKRSADKATGAVKHLSAWLKWIGINAGAQATQAVDAMGNRVSALRWDR